MIFALWHNRMFLMPYLYKRYMSDRRLACLVSASQDGEMIARVLQRFGLSSVRGSSSRRGKEAFLELFHALQEGFDIAITPDGPRGPRYQAHDGVINLAAISGCSLIPVSYHLDRKIELKSWDRFMIPLPFSTCRVVIGTPLQVSQDGPSILEKKRRELEQLLSK
jgi:lysophospholipid acyltransferase (LPLAT)-like uncharacterized protein